MDFEFMKSDFPARIPFFLGTEAIGFEISEGFLIQPVI